MNLNRGGEAFDKQATSPPGLATAFHAERHRRFSSKQSPLSAAVEPSEHEPTSAIGPAHVLRRPERGIETYGIASAPLSAASGTSTSDWIALLSLVLAMPVGGALLFGGGAHIARRRRRHVVFWALIGASFGVVASVAYVSYVFSMIERTMH